MCHQISATTEDKQRLTCAAQLAFLERTQRQCRWRCYWWCLPPQPSLAVAGGMLAKRQSPPPPETDGSGPLEVVRSFDASYVSDSEMGALWRIPPDGSAELWLQHALLEGTDETPGYPPLGANGVAYWQDSLFVANLEKGHMIRIPILAQGQAGEPELVARTVWRAFCFANE